MHWREHEIIELLSIRGLEEIRRQITGTTRDSVVYNRVKKLLQERGINRTHMQVITKLKSLRRQYYAHHREKTLSGTDRVDWFFYELCHQAFGDSPSPGVTAKRSRSPSPSFEPLPAAPTPPPSAVSEKAQPAEEHSIWDSIVETEINEHMAPLEADDDDNDEDLIPPDPPRKKNDGPVAKKRKRTVIDQVSVLVKETVNQLREMDAAMQAQEDARLQKLMDHEREMQNNLLCQLEAMNERISLENHERHLELVDRILSRFPSSSQ